MSVIAPTIDASGAALDAQIVAIQALVTANKNPSVEYQLQQALNLAQVAAVNHYMVIGWLNAATILLTYSAPTWDKVGQAITARIAALQATYTKALAAGMPAGNKDGFGSAGWTTIASAYAQQLYAKQIELVEHLMDLPGGTSAATMLATLTGFQTAPAGISYEYVFNSVGFTDAWIDD